MFTSKSMIRVPLASRHIKAIIITPQSYLMNPKTILLFTLYKYVDILRIESYCYDFVM